jgi:hypothetical protein
VRYYVVNPTDEGEYIAGEIVVDPVFPGEPSPEQDPAYETRRRASAPGRLKGPGTRIVTREELATDPGGRSLLHAWERGDDSRYDREAMREMEQADRADIEDMASKPGDLASLGAPVSAGNQERAQRAQELLRRNPSAAEMRAFLIEDAEREMGEGEDA